MMDDPEHNSVRPIAALEIPNLIPGGETGRPPIFEWVDPSSLLIDERYQRELSDKSLRLIRNIVENWSWAKFKPPITVMTERGLECLDGQHTAIGAATHPGIEQIPVVVVDAPELASRAAAFIGHNRDRIGVTPTQLFYAAVTAGDEDAVTVQQVCERAGIRISKVKKTYNDFRAGETIAVSTINSLVSRRGALRARQILEVLAKANLAPISAADIKATEHLMTDPEFADFAPERITDTIIALSDTAVSDAKLFAATHRVPYWKALASVWFRNRKKRPTPGVAA